MASSRGALIGVRPVLLLVFTYSLLFPFFSLSSSPVAAVSFSEIHYDPDGADAGHEFLELADAPSLAGWTIADPSSNDTLVLLRNASSSPATALIVDDGFDYAGLGCAIYSAGGAIGNGLNNGGDALTLTSPDGNLSLVAVYSGGASAGRSLVLVDGNWTWGVVGGTPCLPETMNGTQGTDTTNTTGTTENESTSTADDNETVSLSIVLPSTVYLGVNYSSLFRVTNNVHMPGETAYVNVTVAYTVTRDGLPFLNASFARAVNSYTTTATGSLLLDGPGNYTLCGTVVDVVDAGMNVTSNTSSDSSPVCAPFAAVDPYAIPCDVTLALDLADDALIRDAGSPVKFRTLVQRNDDAWLPPFVVEYGVYALDGSPLTLKESENANQKSYTPRCGGDVCVYILRGRLAMVACNNSAQQTGDERLLVVRGDPAASPSPESSLSFGDLHEPKAGYGAGDTMRVDVTVYRGDTGKYAVKLWVEDADGKKASDVTSFSARTRFTRYDATLPVVLHDGLKDGTYRVVLDGLDEQVAEEIRIGSSSKTTKNNSVNELAHPVIASFYTRARKAAKNVTLAASLDGGGNYTVELLGLADHHEERVELVGPLQYRQAVALFPGPNLFVLRLRDKKGIAAERSLLLEMGENITAVDSFTLPPLACVASSSPKNGESSGVGKGATGNASSLPPLSDPSSSPSLLTGGVTYAAEHTTDILPVLLGVIGLLLLGIALQQRR